MAVYKIFGSADNTLYSNSPAKNSGLDEILEVTVKNSSTPLNYFVDPVPSTPPNGNCSTRYVYGQSNPNKSLTFETTHSKTKFPKSLPPYCIIFPDMIKYIKQFY